MTDLQELVQTLQMALKAQLLYTANHPRTQSALATLGSRFDDWLTTRPSIHLAASHGKLFVDGTPIESKHVHMTSMARQLSERQIGGIILMRGVTVAELAEVLGLLILKPARIEAEGGAAVILAGKDLLHVRLSQVAYKEVREGEGGEGADDAPIATVFKDRPDTSLQAALEAIAAALPAGQDNSAGGSRGSGSQGSGSQGSGSQGSGPGSGSEGFGSQGSGFKGSGTQGPSFLGSHGSQGPMAAASGPSFLDLELLTEQWEEQLELVPIHPVREGAFQPAGLGFLADSPAGLGMGDGFPSSGQVEGLRRALLALDPDKLMAVVAGLDTLPEAHGGMRMAFQSLATEAFTQAASALLASGTPWEPVREALFQTLQSALQQKAMLAALENELKIRGADPERIGQLRQLIQQLDWETQSMEEKLRQALEQGKLWKLTLEQRLRFLRRLLDEGRIEGLLSLLEQILAALRSDDPEPRTMAAQTLAGVARWTEDPGLPIEAEGPLIEGLSAHFAWEPLAHIHRASTEALGLVVAALVNRGEPGQSLALLKQLSDLCAIQGGGQEWREEAMAGLWRSLGNPARLARVAEQLHTATPEILAGELIPYLETVGMPAARYLMALLGDEPDRLRRAKVLEAVRRLGDLAVPAVYEGLDSPSWFLVRNALNILSEIGDPAALEPVRACLAHPDGRVKRAAVRALWKLSGPASVPQLLAALTQVDPETQSEIMFALVQLRAFQSVSTLAAFAMDRRNGEALRAKAAEAIGQIGDPRSIPVLVDIARRRGRLFSTAEPAGVRLAACRALLALEVPAGWQALCELVADEPWHGDRTVLQQVVASRKTP